MSNGADASPAGELTLLEALAAAKPSLCARALKCCASSAYGIGKLTAAVPLAVSLCYAIVVPEPLWQRMMTVAVLGLVPSSIVLMTGALVGAVLAMGSALVDPASTLCRRLMPSLGRAVLAGSTHSLGVAVTATLRVAKSIGRLIVAEWHAARPRMRGSISSLRRAAAAISCGSSAALKPLLCGLRVIADKLEFLGDMINAMGSMMWMAATFPIRLVANVLLRLTRRRPARVANGNRDSNALPGTRSQCNPSFNKHTNIARKAINAHQYGAATYARSKATLAGKRIERHLVPAILDGELRALRGSIPPNWARGARTVCEETSRREAHRPSVVQRKNNHRD